MRKYINLKKVNPVGKVRKVILTMYMHNESKNCYSGKDFFGVKEFKTFDEFKKFHHSNDEDIASIKYDLEQEILFISYYDLEYKNNYPKIIADYVELKDSSADKEYSTFYDRIKKVKESVKLKKGYVVKYFSKELTALDYKGNLDMLFKNNIVAEYLNNLGVWGYLGHEERTIFSDNYFESKLKELKYDKEIENCIGIWMTSSYARHYMDNFEGLDDESSKIQLDKIFEKIIENGKEMLKNY